MTSIVANGIPVTKFTLLKSTVAVNPPVRLIVLRVTQLTFTLIPILLKSFDLIVYAKILVSSPDTGVIMYTPLGDIDALIPADCLTLTDTERVGLALIVMVVFLSLPLVLAVTVAVNPVLLLLDMLNQVADSDIVGIDVDPSILKFWL